MFQKKAFVLTLIVCLFALLAVGATSGPISLLRKAQDAPLNPAFVRYMEARAQGLVPVLAADGHARGYIPPPVKLPSVISLKSESFAQLAALPASYDLRTVSGVTGVKDQGACGSCWCFAALASLESFLKYIKDLSCNFSEQDMNKNHGFTDAECDGGNREMATAYLARWRGPRSESYLPYPYTMPDIGAQAIVVQRHVQNVWFISYEPDDAWSRATVKNAVQTNGAVFCAFYSNSTYYKASTAAHYCNLADGEEYADHAVAIIGWDDNFAASKFKTAPPGNGAFLVKNSWGTGWGLNGYFWLSYYDTSLCEIAQFLNAESLGKYDKKYEYDPLGETSWFGYVAENSIWGANRFTAGTTANQNRILAVSFYTPVPDATVEISIYKGPNSTNPKSGTKVGSTVTKTMAHAGYNTVKFTTPYVVTAGQKFSVVIKFTTPGYTYPLATERYWEDHSEGVAAAAGQGFYSLDGTTWTDAYTIKPENLRSICIKAFAGD